MSISRSTFLVAVVVASAVTSAAGADDLASAVAGKLTASEAVKGHKVNVRAKAGTVFLEGQVGSAGQIAAAEAAAKTTDGVELVVNRLTVAASASGGLLNSFSIPSSIRSAVGFGAKPKADAPPAEAPPADEPGKVQLTQAVGTPRGGASSGPRPLGAPQARPMQPHAAQRGPVGQQTVALRQPMDIPGPGNGSRSWCGADAGRRAEHAQLRLAELRRFPELRRRPVSLAVFPDRVALHRAVLSLPAGAARLAAGVAGMG